MNLAHWSLEGDMLEAMRLEIEKTRAVKKGMFLI